MRLSMEDLGRIEKLLFYRCHFVVGLLFLFMAGALFFIKQIASSNFFAITASLFVILIALSAYFVFHFFFLNKKIKGLAHFAELGLNSAQVAHDMRSPLCVFKNIVPILAKRIKIENEDVEKMLQVLGRASFRMEGICEDLLVKQLGTLEPSRGFPLHTILDELIDEGKANRSLSGIKFNRNYAPQPIFFWGRQNRLQRVFANIIKNAMESIKFEGEIAVATNIKGDDVIVSIGDNGPGMSPELVSRLLTTGATKGKVKGNGLGMQFIREVIQNHKGELSIDSTEGKGTTIHVQLPYAQAEPLENKITFNSDQAGEPLEADSLEPQEQRV